VLLSDDTGFVRDGIQFYNHHHWAEAILMEYYSVDISNSSALMFGQELLVIVW
jgi:hypothetical protein